MKTQYLKLTAFILAGIICLASYTVSAHKTSDNYKKRSAPVKKSSLADMKIKNIEFGFNKETVPENAYPELDRVAKLMSDNKASINLGGHADNKGSYVYNWKLSKRRADAVKAYLVSKGANESRIAATEYGYTKPCAPNTTATGRQKNRRVEVHFAD